jgi:molecular chaperone Hsp33
VHLTFSAGVLNTWYMDSLIHGTAANGTIRVLAAITTGITSEAVRRHQTSPTVSAALGRTMTGALLLGATLKDFDRLTVKIDATGPVGGLIAETTNKGTVRGYVKNPLAELPAKDNGKIDVGGIVGGGTFYVIREAGFEIGFRPEPYVGSVPIVSGEIAEDFAYYLATSEQIPSAVMLGVLLQNSEPHVAASGGVMVQMMPGANEHIITMIEDTIRNAPHLTTVMTDGATPADLARLALGVVDFEVLEEREVTFCCTCSIEKAIAMIGSLDRNDIEDMLKYDRGAVMNCGFCNAAYQLTARDLDTMLTDR